MNPPVVYLIVCGAGPAADIPTFLNLAKHAGWTVCVTATPKGVELLDVARVSDLVEYPVRLDYEKPSPLWPPADLVLVAPATINSIDKFAAGIADSVALGLLTECFGVDVPVVIAPNVTPPSPGTPASGRTSRSSGSGVFTSCSIPRPHRRPG